VTQATPDFSAGWSAIAGTAAVLGPQKPPAEAKALALEVNRALNTALRLDPKNSEAWALKAYVLPVDRFAEREVLFKRAIAARPLDCGCEHHAYGQFLNEVGRLREAAAEYQRGVDFMPLNEGLYQDLAPAQFASGERTKAMDTAEAGKKISRRPEQFDVLQACLAIWGGDFRRAKSILGSREVMDNRSAKLMMPAVEALAARDGRAIARARATILAETQDLETNRPVAIMLLATLGDTENALAAIERLAKSRENAVAVLGMTERADRFHRNAVLRGLEPHDAEELRGAPDSPGPQVDAPDSDAGRALGEQHDHEDHRRHHEPVLRALSGTTYDITPV